MPDRLYLRMFWTLDYVPCRFPSLSWPRVILTVAVSCVVVFQLCARIRLCVYMYVVCVALEVARCDVLSVLAGLGD